MPCHFPIEAWVGRKASPAGKPLLVFDHSKASPGTKRRISCGICQGCRLERSREWALRLHCESLVSTSAHFLTLTYSDDHLPEQGSLDPEDWRLFLKRLRRAEGPGIRYFMCGEYGEDQNQPTRLGRPHFHAIVFNGEFDLLEHGRNQHGPLYISEKLDDLWGKGIATIDIATPRTMGYTARYLMKKQGGKKAEEHYIKAEPTTGEIYPVLPEYSRQSTRPGIGRRWFDQYGMDCRKGFLMFDGKKTPVPRYFLKLMEQRDPEVAEQMKIQRKRAMPDLDDPEFDTPRMVVKNAITQRRVHKLKRVNQ